MKFSIITLFPEMFSGPFDYSIIKKAKNKKIIEIEFVNIRQFGIGKHRIVDDKPYGGGVGMILRVDVLYKAVQKTLCKKKNKCREKIILLDAGGQTLTQEKVNELSQIDHLILICGHYEGVDNRLRNFIDDEISIGDYILTGGEIPAMIIVDAVARLLPAVLGKEESSLSESFEIITDSTKKNRIIEYPQYTRPFIFKNLKVPGLLISGNHQKISEWKQKEAIKRTSKSRPDLLRN